jgi:hypothetical protein
LSNLSIIKTNIIREPHMPEINHTLSILIATTTLFTGCGGGKSSCCTKNNPKSRNKNKPHTIGEEQ